MNKLKKAINNEFYYEAIFIEYAILEEITKHESAQIIYVITKSKSKTQKLKIKYMIK